jgi:hypothetical protein
MLYARLSVRTCLWGCLPWFSSWSTSIGVPGWPEYNLFKQDSVCHNVCAGLSLRFIWWFWLFRPPKIRNPRTVIIKAFYIKPLSRVSEVDILSVYWNRGFNMTGIHNNNNNNNNSVTLVRERTILTERRRLSAKLVSTFADREGYRVVSAVDLSGRNLGFVDRSRYYFFQVAPQLHSRGWVDPVPDPLRLRKSGSTGNWTRTSGSVAMSFAFQGRISDDVFKIRVNFLSSRRRLQCRICQLKST